MKDTKIYRRKACEFDSLTANQSRRHCLRLFLFFLFPYGKIELCQKNGNKHESAT